MNEERSELGDQESSSEASNITISGGSPSSSVNMANFQIPPSEILELNDGEHGLLCGRTILWLQNSTKKRKLVKLQLYWL